MFSMLTCSILDIQNTCFNPKILVDIYNISYRVILLGYIYYSYFIRVFSEYKCFSNQVSKEHI